MPTQLEGFRLQYEPSQRTQEVAGDGAEQVVRGRPLKALYVDEMWLYDIFFLLNWGC